VQQDLEKGCIFIWGIAKEGRFRFKLEAKKEAILFDGKSFDYAGPHIDGPARERLSLGSHKAQDWDQVVSRLDLRDILPVLFHLSQWVPPTPQVDTAMLRLLNESFESLLLAGFTGILSPRLIDDEYQGILPPEKLPAHVSPCILVTEAGRRIRELFIKQEKGKISLSPGSFECGRMTDVLLEGIGALDFEWSKGRIQRAILRATETATICFEMSKPLHSYRLRASMREKGRRMDAGSEWECQKGEIYFLDRFQK
jgi:hypothetical protein